MAHRRNKQRTVGSIIQEIEQSNAIKVDRRLRELDINYFVFERNYRDLKMYLSELSLDKYSQIMSDPIGSENALYHITRVFHNFIASAKTLTDHTRILINDWYKNTEFIKEYQKEIVNRFISNDLCQFVEGLRNYILHIALPVCGYQLNVTRDEKTDEYHEEFYFFFDKPKLLEWDGWKKGRKYLDTCVENIPLEKFIDAYFEQVTAFHSWMHKRLEEIHSDDLAWLDEKRKQAQDLLDKQNQQSNFQLTREAKNV